MTVLSHLTAYNLRTGQTFESLVILQNKYGKTEADKQIAELKQQGKVSEHPGMNQTLIKLIK